MSDELNPYPGNMKHHKVDKEEQRKLLCEMMQDDANSGMYDAPSRREPLFTDAAVELEPEIFDARYIRDIYESARAKDAELIQRLLNDMQDFVDKVENGEARSKRSYAAFKHSIEIAAAAGFKPSGQ